MGNFVPCFTVAFSLFCVTFRLREQFANALRFRRRDVEVQPRSSANADRSRSRSSARPRPRFTFKRNTAAGRDRCCSSWRGDQWRRRSRRPWSIGADADVCGAPPKDRCGRWCVVPAKPQCTADILAKERDAEMTRASISTCCDLRSSWWIRLSMVGKARRNIANDQLVGAVIRENIAARG